jgi:hypothetical protein
LPFANSTHHAGRHTHVHFEFAADRDHDIVVADPILSAAGL